MRRIAPYKMAHLQQLLQEMTEVSDVSRHPELLAAITREIPNTIRLLASPYSINRHTCLVHVFGFAESREYIEIACRGFNVMSDPLHRVGSESAYSDTAVAGPGGLNKSPGTGTGAVFAGVSLIRVRPGIFSKCFLLFEMSGIVWRIAHEAIQRSFGATTNPGGSDARSFPYVRQSSASYGTMTTAFNLSSRF